MESNGIKNVGSSRKIYSEDYNSMSDFVKACKDLDIFLNNMSIVAEKLNQVDILNNIYL